MSKSIKRLSTTAVAVLFAVSLAAPNAFTEDTRNKPNWEELQKLKQTDPERFERIVQERKEKIKNKLQELKEKDPEKYREVKEKIKMRRREQLERLRRENPEKFRQVMENKMQKIQRLKTENPERYQQFMKNHPRLAERLEHRAENNGVRDHGEGMGRGPGQGGFHRAGGTGPHGGDRTG